MNPPTSTTHPHQTFNLFDLCRALLQHWVGLLYGFVAILVITPCFGFLMMLIPLQPREFATGLALFCVVPTTLGVGVALTAAAKGNQALALLLTVRPRTIYTRVFLHKA